MNGGVLHMKDIVQMEQFDIHQNHILSSKFVFNNSEYIDYEWIAQQISYMDTLSDRQKHIIRAYTTYADKFINAYLRNTLTRQTIYDLILQCKHARENPFLYQHIDFTNMTDIDDVYVQNIVEYIRTFISEFSAIILQSPRTTKQIKVFRGIRDDNYFITSMRQNNNGHSYIDNDDYVSTSINVISAFQFMTRKGCLMELYIEPGMPCLFTAYLSRRRGEYEITLPPKTLMKYIHCEMKYVFHTIDLYKSNKGLINPKKCGAKMVKVCECSVSLAIHI